MDCSCAVFGCPNTTSNGDPNIQYFFFPMDPPIAKQWLDVCWSDEQFDINAARICSMHFDDDSYTTYEVDDNGICTKLLKCEAVPTLFLPTTASIIGDASSNIDLEMLDGDSSCPEISDLSAFVIDSSQYVLQYVEEIEQAQKNDITTCSSTSINDANYTLNILNDGNMNVEYTHIINLPNPVEDLKYLAVGNISQLLNMKNENRDMRRLIAEKERMVEYLNNELELEILDCRNIDAQIKKAKIALAKLKKKTLSFNEEQHILKKVFSESQMKVLTGENKLCSYWSHDDMAVGYTLRQISNKRFYTYLMKTMKFPMPAWSSIRKWCFNKNLYSDKETNNLTKEDIISVEDSE